ncbi:MAG: GNAT family N-acetyltransferase [Bacilli bacterium]|nr:GNAT family N-acetyltransferase [Bacilli bacterium]
MKIRINDLRCINQDINLDKYIEFRTLVKKSMPFPEWLGDFSKEELNDNIINNDGKIWVYYDDEIPVCSMMLIPSTEKSIKKFELSLDFKDVIDYGPMFVNPEYVGNGLQYQMLTEIDNYARTLGYKYAVGTIHPDNIYSINNLLKDNFELHGTKVFNRGLRNIYIKDLRG